MKKLINRVLSFAQFRNMAHVEESSLRLLLTQLRDNAQDRRIYAAFRRAVRTHSNEQDDLDAAALFAYRFDYILGGVLGGRRCESKDLVKEATLKVRISDITKNCSWSAEKIYDELYAMRNDIVHYGSVKIDKRDKSYVAGDASCLIVYALALCYQVTQNPPSRISGMLAFMLAMKDLWYAFSRTFGAIKSFLSLIVRIVATIIMAVWIWVTSLFVNALRFIGIFVIILIVGGVVWGIVRLTQDDYDLQTTDYEKIAEIVIDISPAQKTEAIQNRFISLYALGKDFRIGDNPLDSIDRSTVALYNMAIEQELPKTYSIHQIGHLFGWLLPTEKEDFHTMVAEHRESFVKPKNRYLGNFQYDNILVVKNLFSTRTYEMKKIVDAMNETPGLRVLLVLGNVKEIARKNGLSQRQFISQIKSEFRNFFKELGLDPNRMDLRSDSSLPFCLQLYVIGVPRRTR